MPPIFDHFSGLWFSVTNEKHLDPDQPDPELVAHDRCMEYFTEYQDLQRKHQVCKRLLAPCNIKTQKMWEIMEHMTKLYAEAERCAFWRFMVAKRCAENEVEREDGLRLENEISTYEMRLEELREMRDRLDDDTCEELVKWSYSGEEGVDLGMGYGYFVSEGADTNDDNDGEDEDEDDEDGGMQDAHQSAYDADLENSSADDSSGRASDEGDPEDENSEEGEDEREQAGGVYFHESLDTEFDSDSGPNDQDSAGYFSLHPFHTSPGPLTPFYPPSRMQHTTQSDGDDSDDENVVIDSDRSDPSQGESIMSWHAGLAEDVTLHLSRNSFAPSDEKEAEQNCRFDFGTGDDKNVVTDESSAVCNDQSRLFSRDIIVGVREILVRDITVYHAEIPVQSYIPDRKDVGRESNEALYRVQSRPFMPYLRGEGGDEGDFGEYGKDEGDIQQNDDDHRETDQAETLSQRLHSIALRWRGQRARDGKERLPTGVKQLLWL